MTEGTISFGILYVLKDCSQAILRRRKVTRNRIGQDVREIIQRCARRLSN